MIDEDLGATVFELPLHIIIRAVVGNVGHFIGVIIRLGFTRLGVADVKLRVIRIHDPRNNILSMRHMGIFTNGG